MLFIPYEAASKDGPRVHGFSIVRVADGHAWDFKAREFRPGVAAQDVIRPLAWLTSPVHAGRALAVADVPPPEPFALAVYFHAEGGAVLGDPVPVDVAPAASLPSVVVFARG